MAQLFEPRTIGTLAGASLVVVVTTAVLKDIADPPPQYLKIVALIVAEVLAFVAAALIRPRSAVVFFLAFFKGLLIYATATGLNTMHNFHPGKQQQAALVPGVDTVAWWPPAEMAELQAAAGATSKTITETAPVLGRGAAVLKDPRLPLRDQAAELQRQLANVPDQRRKLQERLDALAKEAERPVHPAEREAVERLRAKNRDDLQRDQARLDELEKNAKQRLEEFARLEATLGEAQRLTAPFAESAEDATRKLARASEELKAAVAAANRVTGLQK